MHRHRRGGIHLFQTSAQLTSTHISQCPCTMSPWHNITPKAPLAQFPLLCHSLGQARCHSSRTSRSGVKGLNPRFQDGSCVRRLYCELKSIRPCYCSSSSNSPCSCLLLPLSTGLTSLATARSVTSDLALPPSVMLRDDSSSMALTLLAKSVT